jgi:thiamine-phosphate pyrophosphorylase
VTLDLSLYLVADSGLCGERGVVATVQAAVQGGVSVVQVREPQATTRELCRLAEAVHNSLAGTGVPLFVNDRLDVALAIGAEGVHLGQSDLPPDAARRIADVLIGVTVSNPAEVATVRGWPVGTVDYLGLAPVFATATKPEAGPGLGLSGTAELRSAAGDLACVAIGGITAANVDQVRATGVSGVAVVSAICAAADPRSAAAALR